MNDELVGILLLLILFIFFGAMVYLIFSLTSSKIKMKTEIKRMFNTKESGNDLLFKYRGYDIIATFRPHVKISIVHNRDVEGIKAPKGATLTPMYLIFKVKKTGDLPTMLDTYIDFLNSIPTR